MKLSMIAAMDQNRVIGSDNQMPWHLPDDLKFFKAMTLGKPVIMGRKTFESIGSKALPNRRNIVISRNADYKAPGAEVWTSVGEVLAELSAEEEVVIMGGGQLYEQMLPFADKLYLTRVQTAVKGDTLFPLWRAEDWQEVEKTPHPSDERHAYPFKILVLIRKN